MKKGITGGICIVLLVSLFAGGSLLQRNYYMEMLQSEREAHLMELAGIEPEIQEKEKIVEKIVEKVVEKEPVFTGAIVQDGLREMGVLITQEYYFTEVIDKRIVAKIAKMEVKSLEAGFVASYDGRITAGLNFEEIEITKDEESLAVFVTLPPAEIFSTEVYHDSFKLYDEKDNIVNRIRVEDVNEALVGLEETAREKAVERGLLENAEESAKLLIRNYIGSLVDLSQYKLIFISSLN